MLVTKANAVEEEARCSIWWYHQCNQSI